MEDRSFLKAQLLSIVENTPDLVALSNPDKKLTFINKAGRGMLGLGPDEDVSDFSVFDAHPPAVCEFLINEAFPEAIRNGVWSGETTIKTRRGKERLVSQVIVVHKLPDGTLAGFSTIMRDMTGCQQTEKQLKLYGDIVSRMQTGIYVFRLDNRDDDGSFRLITANDASTQKLGLPQKESIGKRIDELFPSLRPQGLLPTFVSVVKTGKPVQLDDYFYKDQRINGYFSLNIFALPDDCVCVLFEDVTARRQAEDALKVSENFLNSAFDQSPYAQWISDESGTLIKLNQACRDLLCISDEEVVGTYNVLKDDIVERQGFLPLVKSVFERGEKVKFMLEYDTSALEQIKLKKKVLRVLEVAISPIKNSAGKVTNAIIQHVDITDRKKAEGELQRALERVAGSNKEWEKTFNSMSDGVALLSTDWEILNINDPFCAMLNKRREDLIGKKCFDAVHGREAPLPGCPCHSVKESKKKTEVEIFEENLKLWLAVSVSPVLNEEGAILYLIHVVRNITDRKRMEASLRDREQELMSVMNGMPVPQFVIGADHRVRYWNKALEMISGIKAEDIIGTDQHWKAFYAEPRPCLSDLLVDEAYDKIPQYYRQKYTQSNIMEHAYEATDQFLMPLKGRRWLNFSAVAVRSQEGKILGAVETLEDITSRKQAEDQLVASEEQYRALVNNLSVGVYRNTPDGRFIQANPAMAKIFGYDSIDELLQIPGLSLHIDPEGRNKYLQIMREAGFVSNREFLLRKRNGDALWAIVSSRAHFDAQGAIDWIDGMVEDITVRKQEEIRALKLKSSLESLWGLAKIQDKSVKDLSDYILEEIKRLTESKYAFYGFVNDAETEMTIFSWSHETMQECAIHDKPLVFSLANAGIWADAVRKRQSIIVNDYKPGLEGAKGVPQGHVALTRVLSVPVFKKGKIVAVGAVANKQTAYSPEDVVQLEAFLNNSQIITDRKEIEEALQNSESKFRALFDNMSSGVAVYAAFDAGEDFIIKEFNRAAERIEKVKKEDMLGKRILEVFPGVKDFGILAALRRVWTTGNPEFLPVNLYKDERISGWRENYIYKLPSGEVVAVYEDVTERKQAELERNRLFDMSIDMMAVAGFDGYFKQVNPSWERILGWTGDEMKNKPYLEYVHPDDIRKTLEAAEKLQQGQPMYNFRNRYKSKAGAYLWLSWNSFPYPEQKIILAIARDVTEEQKAQDALKASELRYRMLFEAAKDGILIIHADSGNIVDINPYLADLLGRPKEYFLGKKVWELGFLSDTLASQKSFQDLQSKGYCHYENLPLQKANGDKLQVEFVSNVYMVGGKRSIQCNIRDITERLKTQEQIRRLNAELEERVRQRTAQLEASMKELDSFSYSVSHDLQAPLRAIDGYAHIILEDHAAQLDEEGKKQFDRISANVRKMGQLINDLLSLSRLDRKEMTYSVIDLNKLVRRCIDELKPSYEGRAIVFKIKDIVSAHGDESLLHEAFMNLLSNAIKFTRPQPKASVEIGSYAADGERVYYVKDNGVGFNMAYAGNIFKEFVRLHHESEFEGTGVGLSIVNRVISRHAGRIWTESKIDKGAVFYFTLGNNPNIPTK